MSVAERKATQMKKVAAIAIPVAVVAIALGTGFALEHGTTSADPGQGTGAAVTLSPIATLSPSPTGTVAPSAPPASPTQDRAAMESAYDSKVAAQDKLRSQQPVPVASVLAAASTPAPPAPLGISSQKAGPFSPTVFLVRNRWVGSVAGHLYTLWAGADRNADGSSGQAALKIFTPAGNLLSVPVVGADSPLHVVSSTSSTVTVQTDGGASYTYDVGTGTLTKG